MIRHAVREKNGRWVKANNASSAIGTALHGSTRTGVEHQVQQIDDLTGEVTTVKVKPGSPHIASNQVFRSTSRGK